MQLCWHVIDMRNHADVDIEIFYDIYRDVILIKWYSVLVPEKQQNHVKLFKRYDCCSILLAIFYLRSQCALYFRVCSTGISRLFLCAMNINESVISITSTESRHGKLYNSATEQLVVFVQNFKSYYKSTRHRHVRIFLPICGHEKKISTTAQPLWPPHISNLSCEHWDTVMNCNFNDCRCSCKPGKVEGGQWAMVPHFPDWRVWALITKRHRR